MPFYVKQGQIPHKRHIAFEKENGNGNGNDGGALLPDRGDGVNLVNLSL